jgi:hypothetical protein
LDSESNDSKKKGKWDGKQLFEEKTGGGKDARPAKNLREKECSVSCGGNKATKEVGDDAVSFSGSDDLFLVRWWKYIFSVKNEKKI